MKRISALLLVLLLMLGFAVSASAENAQSCAAVGADLTEEQLKTVYALFGISRGSVPEMKVTNAEERQYLEGLVADPVIGTRSISCVYVELRPQGSGMNIQTYNITWCTADMYVNALQTAGITDAAIIVAAPFEVSGTAALTGIYKAYESLTGQTLDDEAKKVGTEELTITGDLSDAIGSKEAAAVIREVKEILNETEKMSDEQLRSEIVKIAASYNVKLNDSEVAQIVQWCRKLEKLNIDTVLQSVSQIQGTVEKISEARDDVVGFARKVQNFFTAVSSFFQRVKSWFS